MSTKNSVQKFCEVCRSAFKCVKSRSSAKYCSKSCYGKAKSTLTDVVCHQCGVLYCVPAHRLSKTRFCTPRCTALANLPLYAEKRLIAATVANSARALPPGQRAVNKKAGSKRRYEKNKEEILAQQAVYYRETKPERQAWGVGYYEKNGETIRERARQRRINMPEEVRAARRQHYQENKVRYKANARRRAIDKLRATPLWANLEAIEVFYQLADSLTRETGIPHHVDHVIPLRNKFVCGLHVENNLQVITKAANLKKGNRFNPEAKLIWQEL